MEKITTEMNVNNTQPHREPWETGDMKRDVIWGEFENAMGEQFLAGGKLPHCPDGLGLYGESRDWIVMSQALTDLFHAACQPLPCMLDAVANLQLADFQLHTSNSCSRAKGAVQVTTAYSEWLNIELCAGFYGISVRVTGGDYCLWSSGIRFDRRSLEPVWNAYHEIDYTDWLMKCYRCAVEVCDRLETATQHVRNELGIETDTTNTKNTKVPA